MPMRTIKFYQTGSFVVGNRLLDLDWGIVNRVLEREKNTRRSGPVAEGVLRDIGTVASRIG